MVDHRLSQTVGQWLTAIPQILINAMTPPAYIPLANGLAQSAVSLARFIGPLSGGIIWSNSIKDGPEVSLAHS